jgi:hypothetical protein
MVFRGESQVHGRGIHWRDGISPGITSSWTLIQVGSIKMREKSSVAEPCHFYAAPAPGKKFDAALAPAPVAPVPILLYSKGKFLKRTKV